MTTDKLIKIRRALLSVSDKTDLIPFAKALTSRGISIISTGGTARALTDAGIDVTQIKDVTGFPEIMDGRIKTLHPLIHGGILARRDEDSHLDAMKLHDIEHIDLVCVNLYPFEKTMRSKKATRREIIEKIDIGGPSMIRSAAKNFEFITVVTSPDMYDRVINELDKNNGATTLVLRSELATTAFSRTADYDATIASWLQRCHSTVMPDQFRVNMMKVTDLRYGENPHQKACLYRDPASRGPSVVNADLLHGKPLSYNNLNDAAAALALVREFDIPAAAVIKHTNPCGAAVKDNLAKAFELAYAGDPRAAYGGILAANRNIDKDTAALIIEGKKFFEVIVAVSYADDALEMLKARWSTVRILAVGAHEPTPYRKVDFKSIPGGMIVQDQDLQKPNTKNWKHAAGPAPKKEQLKNASILWSICKHLKSNAIAIGNHGQLYGAGAGQMDRVGACKIAVEKAGADNTQGAIAASDAFFPFTDGPQVLIDAGIKMLVQPGGSKRDQDTLDLCDEKGVTCMLTGIRHFKH